jgi:hypothetical protein
MISSLPFSKREDQVRNSPINTGLQAGDSPPEMEASRFNGLSALSTG